MIQETSRRAYQEIKGLNERHEQILKALREGGSMTDKEIQNFLGKHDANDVRPRRNELASVLYGQRIALDMTFGQGKRKCRVTGKLAYVWKVNEKQLDMFSAA